MDYSFLGGSNDATSVVGVVLISGTCCNPSLGALDEQARRIIQMAAEEAGIEVEVETITMTSAYYSAPKSVRRRLMADFARGRLEVPAILIAGKAVSYGIPSVETIKSALLESVDPKIEAGRPS